MLSRNNNVRISKSGNGYSFNYSQYCSADIRQSIVYTYLSVLNIIFNIFIPLYCYNVLSVVYKQYQYSVRGKQTNREGGGVKTEPRYLCCYIQFCTYILCLQILSYMYIIKSQCHIVIAKQFVHMSLNFYLWTRLI